MRNTSNISFDPCQQRVISLNEGYHLVLAPPGCGKTQILTERIRLAVSQGIDCRDMICLTFTNRAARGMAERIGTQIDDFDTTELYVGNVHRFCSRFLFENGLIPSETAIIDDEDAINILARFVDDGNHGFAEQRRQNQALREASFLEHLMHQLKSNHPKELRLHADCLSRDDIEAMKKLCLLQNMDFTPQSMIDIYEHAETYETAVLSAQTDLALVCLMMPMLRKMKLARCYGEYKRDNKLADFEDLLLMTYDALKADADNKFRRYSWVQVDEVQDLNPLQLAIIDEITAPNAVVVYLGDEQQAIFSFMGAKLDTLNLLRMRCGTGLHQLSVNHRSPKYLLDVFNTYARDVLHVSSELLPQADNNSEGKGTELQVVGSSIPDTEVEDVALLAGSLSEEYPNETTAIIVNSNRDADAISAALQARGLSHFKVSGQDLFSTNGVKLLNAHLSAIANPHNFIAWVRLLQGVCVFESYISACNFVQSLMSCAMLPSDLLEYNDSSYINDFCNIFDNRDIVIFDTETTGLNIFEDDIIQIAAVKMRRGTVITGSQFNVFIRTARPVPAMLGDIPNPILEQLENNTLQSAADALRSFMQYVGDAVLLAHNAEFDYNILDNNLRRYCAEISLPETCPKYFDSLRIIRQLEPNLCRYKLKHLLEVLHLEGSNSHLADEDVMATVSLVNYCRTKAEPMLDRQQAFLNRKRVKECAATFCRNYRDSWIAARTRRYVQVSAEQDAALLQELHEFYNCMIDQQLIQPIENLHYIDTYLRNKVLSPTSEPSLAEQLSRHILEIVTLKEADLCSSEVITERIFVTTVHKAKGLEYDNVIVFDAVDGRYPNHYTRTNLQHFDEDTRKFYVAITRARRRLFVTWAQETGGSFSRPRTLTPFMTPILRYFSGA